MKKIFLLVLLSVALFSCSLTKEPVYKELNNFKVESLSKNNIILTANALFENPNSIGVKLVKTDVDVFFENEKVAAVEAPEFKIKAKGNFSVPLTVNIPYKSLFKKSNLLGSAFKLISNEPLKLHYKGVMTFKILGINVDYNVDETEEIKLVK